MKKIYAEFDKNGHPIGFYDPLFNKSIPDNAIEISERDWKEFLENQNARIWNGVKPVFYDPPDKRTYIDKRLSDYPPIGDFADAYIRQAIEDKKQGKKFVPEMEKYLDDCIAVKNRHPKIG